MDLQIFGSLGLLFTTQCLSERYKVTNQFYLLIKHQTNRKCICGKKVDITSIKAKTLWDFAHSTKKKEKKMFFTYLYLYIKLPSDSEYY